MQLYAEALKGLSTGGKKLEASLQEIEEGKRQAIAGGQAGAIRGGLGGTTVMGAIPLSAEKTAARKRLGARGEAEQTYLTTLASFAAFAQRGEEAQKQRAFEAQQAELGRIERRPPKPGTAASPFDVFGRYKEGRGPSGDGGGGGGQAQQFPSLYGQAEQVEQSPPPNLMGGGDTADTPWPTMAPFGGTVYGTQKAFEQGGGQPIPTPQQVGMTGAMGSLPGQTPQPGQTKPQVDTTGWTEVEKRAWANYVPGVSGYNVAARKGLV